MPRTEPIPALVGAVLDALSAARERVHRLVQLQVQERRALRLRVLPFLLAATRRAVSALHITQPQMIECEGYLQVLRDWLRRCNRQPEHARCNARDRLSARHRTAGFGGRGSHRLRGAGRGRCGRGRA
eukprot:933267-Rhodomonas_salina.8